MSSSSSSSSSTSHSSPSLHRHPSPLYHSFPPPHHHRLHHLHLPPLHHHHYHHHGEIEWHACPHDMVKPPHPRFQRAQHHHQHQPSLPLMGLHHHQISGRHHHCHHEHGIRIDLLKKGEEKMISAPPRLHQCKSRKLKRIGRREMGYGGGHKHMKMKMRIKKKKMLRRSLGHDELQWHHPNSSLLPCPNWCGTINKSESEGKPKEEEEESLPRITSAVADLHLLENPLPLPSHLSPTNMP